MTTTPNNDPAEDLPAALAELLANDAVWAEADPLEDEAIVAAVLGDIGSENAVETVDAAATDAPDNVVAMPSRWKSAVLGAAAALVLVAGIFGMSRLGGEQPDLEVALAGTELAVGASATAEISERDAGTLIVLDVSNLPPAEPGTYYEAWLRKDAEIGVSAGTFHLRNGDEPIQLWAGVSADEYPLLTVTIQPETQAESSGRVVLKARLDE